ncbi:predicted protein [Chaetomium globosum CBS 148.51]|uniref:Uncharacterized protein n=1 Tax=Chaetomium globosum (strain ATCC 6205 / CBS 148.51 / DSM 1962 / NBRC 6347 / NRRL 1970) TaxID=306901 RepID=Q2HD75_CHAGB|nr:uncharacterized protein CHGG_01829 [Chaetomium globosum CBS 148.51]EAQ93594.1 predicted protein [Chaetomium globosum CBS 148.51]
MHKKPWDFTTLPALPYRLQAVRSEFDDCNDLIHLSHSRDVRGMAADHDLNRRPSVTARVAALQGGDNAPNRRYFPLQLHDGL